MSITVTLMMIIKDEGHIIESCLSKILPFINSWCVVDTGSKDNTPELVQKTLGHLPGKLYHRPWVSFGHNRGECLELARCLGDYALILDADDEWVCDKNFKWPEVQDLPDAFEMFVHMNGVMWKRLELLNTKRPWHYTDGMHAVPTLPLGPASKTVFISDAKIIARTTGRRHVEDSVGKYVKDAQAFEELLQQGKVTPRNVFYCAQSHRDAGQLEQAKDRYLQRSQMGGWIEEVWYSLYQVGLLYERLNDRDQAILFLLRAFDKDPERAEPLIALSSIFRRNNQFGSAHVMAATATKLKLPDRKLFLEPAAYTWRPLDELALACYRLGRFEEAFELNNILIHQVPPDHIKRIEKNLEFCALHRAS